MNARLRPPPLPVDWRNGSNARLGPRVSVRQRLAHRVRCWMPANREDRDAAYFAAGEAWMAFVLGGAWLAIHFL